MAGIGPPGENFLYQEPLPIAFGQVAKRVPERIAIEAGAQRWTYARLAGTAAAVAESLVKNRLRQGDRIAVTGPRTPGLIANLLGVLAAGGVIVPIDPALPRRRREKMSHAAGVSRTIGTQTPESGVDLAAVASRIRPEDPAYVFFTSGTTGVPNAVLGRHAGLAHFLSWQRTRFGIREGDRCAQLTSLSFDVVLRDIFLPLVAGATLCLPETGETPPPEQVLDWLRRERITVVHAVPTLTRSWLATGEPVGSVRCVFFAGEPLPATLVEDWRARCPSTADVVNLYGPTETTLAKAFHRVPAPAPPGIQSVGSPLPDTRILVLAPDGTVCPPGSAGEIAIGTPFATAGYLDDPERTASRFMPDPDGPGTLFRTGDRGVVGPDGLLRVLGRLDDQIKIRGVRIEPAEVAAVLSEHESVESAAVVADPGPDGDKQLHAYVVPAGQVTPGELRAELAEMLPAVMVPGRIDLVTGLPATPNGKLDRSELDITTRTVIEIWSAVLGVPVTGPDDFFELGGHSLHAATMLSRIRERLGTDVAMRTLFRHPTAEAFAKALREDPPAPARPRITRFARTYGELPK